MAKAQTPICSPDADGAADTDQAQSKPLEDLQHDRFVTQLFDRYKDSLLKYLLGLLTHRADAEDVLQETYLRLLKARNLDRTLSRARAYMFKIATNLAYDRFRRRDEKSIEDLKPWQDTWDAKNAPEFIVDLAQTVQTIERTLLELKPRCRRVFLLRVSEGLSYEAIASTLSVSKRTVEREMRHALDLLQIRLKR